MSDNSYDIHNEKSRRKNENQRVDSVAMLHDPVHKRRKKHLDQNIDSKKQFEDDDTDHKITTSSATMCTALHRLRPYSTSNEFVASFDVQCVLGEESSSCAFELSTSIDSTDFSNTSTSQLQHASFSTPVHVLLEDTMHQLSNQNTVFIEEDLLKISHYTKVCYIATIL